MWHGRVMDRLNDGCAPELFAGGLLNGGQSRPFIEVHPTRANTIKVPRDVTDVRDVLCLIDDREVVDDHNCGLDAFAEMVVVHEYEGCVHRAGSEESARRRERRPANKPAADSPRNPRRRPFHAGHPHPAINRVIHPIAVVITCPCPRLVAIPIPAAIGPFPVTVAIGPPAHHHASGMPATTIGADRDPGAAGRQRGIELGRGMNLHRSGNLQIGAGRKWGNGQNP